MSPCKRCPAKGSRSLIPTGSLIALWKLGAEARARILQRRKKYLRKKKEEELFLASFPSAQGDAL